MTVVERVFRVLLPTILVFSSGALHAAIPTPERQALIDLYNSTSGSGWAMKTNWLSPPGTECTWFGVTCDAPQMHIETIALNGNNLTGALPPSLGSLTNLTSLQIDTDNLSGSIPAQLGSLTNLQAIDLNGNQLSGGIPPQVGSLTNLQSLTLSGNHAVRKSHQPSVPPFGHQPAQRKHPNAPVPASSLVAIDRS